MVPVCQVCVLRELEPACLSSTLLNRQLEIEDTFEMCTVDVTHKLAHILALSHKYDFVQDQAWAIRKIKTLFHADLASTSTEHHVQFDGIWDNLLNSCDPQAPQGDLSLAMCAVYALMASVLRCHLETALLQHLAWLVAYSNTMADPLHEFPDTLKLCLDMALNMGYQPLIGHVYVQILHLPRWKWNQFELTSDQKFAILGGSHILTAVWQDTSEELTESVHASNCKNDTCRAAAGLVYRSCDSSNYYSTMRSHDVFYRLIYLDAGHATTKAKVHSSFSHFKIVHH